MKFGRNIILFWEMNKTIIIVVISWLMHLCKTCAKYISWGKPIHGAILLKIGKKDKIIVIIIKYMGNKLFSILIFIALMAGKGNRGGSVKKHWARK